MIDFIDKHREEYGVEPICEVLPIAPATYYAHKARRARPRAAPRAHEAGRGALGRDPPHLAGQLRRRLRRREGVARSCFARASPSRGAPWSD